MTYLRLFNFDLRVTVNVWVVSLFFVPTSKGILDTKSRPCIFALYGRVEHWGCRCGRRVSEVTGTGREGVFGARQSSPPRTRDRLSWSRGLKTNGV